ncbi:hypothetical protein K402DRAFT_185386 [Aulographum hederae CBS 113979]|uniref:RRM domain-containing protein n=1 Tax=Aulographum hederae CBS 113979 TaxID=1176131 RepID=A0A6G1GPV7_9PEZI|nr:hypothetical protein K402DRAFT_185386 [Aulographum hederae CBS 113979]
MQGLDGRSKNTIGRWCGMRASTTTRVNGSGEINVRVYWGQTGVNQRLSFHALSSLDRGSIGRPSSAPSSVPSRPISPSPPTEQTTNRTLTIQQQHPPASIPGCSSGCLPICSMSPPKRQSSSAGGVLPIPTGVIQKKGKPNASPTKSPQKTPPQKLKVVLRRLAPALTEAELSGILGEEWTVGAGKVDWLDYKAGKVSRDAAKPSRPSRAYFHLTEQSHLAILSDKVRLSQFIDAKNSYQDAALIGPPVLEYALNPKIPSPSAKTQQRDKYEGLIDQDPEYQAFLESLTNPTVKPSTLELDAEGSKDEKLKHTTTPLIEAIREKKAAKERPAAPKTTSKNARQDPKETKTEKGDKKSAKSGKEAASSPEKGKKLSKAEKAAKDAVTILNKEASAAKPADTARQAPAPEKRRVRGDISAAARIIQKDLGAIPRERRSKAKADPPAKPEEPVSKEPSSPSSSRSNSVAPNARAPKKEVASRSDRRRNQKSNQAEKVNVNTTEVNKPTLQPGNPPIIMKKPPVAAQSSPPKGPAASRSAPKNAPSAPAAASPTATTSAVPATASKSPPSAPTPNVQSRHAFLKHANASQGITEPLIEAALSAYGAIEKVEIDKRKGFAYVDFADIEGLNKAIQASPVKIAQGAVQVLEKKDRGPKAPVGPARGAAMTPAPGFRGGRGGRGGRGQAGRGGFGPTVLSNASPASAPAPLAESPISMPLGDAT